MSEIMDRCRIAVAGVIQNSNLPVGSYVDSEKIVRAVLTALREPTDHMLEAVLRDNSEDEEADLVNWQSMIDAALA